VVIGAPYEADVGGGRGAVYVYNGCATGVWPHYSQRVAGSALGPGLQAFGAAFSRARDMDGDGIKGGPSRVICTFVALCVGF